MAKSTKNAKSGQQAATKSGQQATTGRKVAKAATKATKQAPAKAAKSTKPAKASGQQAARAKYAGRKIRVLLKGDAAPNFRGGRAVRWAMVQKAKTTDDVLGKSYTLDGESEARTFNASNLAPFVEAGCIAID